MRSEPALEAVRIDAAQRRVSVATLGPPKAGEVIERLTEQLQQIGPADSAPDCALMAGQPSCALCPEAEASFLSDQRMEVKHEGAVTTLARVTCPTAPRFWRWREMPLPRLLPREVTFSGEEDYEGEARQQLVAAALCGGLGVAAWGLGPGPWSQGLFLAAYAAGSWFTVHEILERLRQGVLDIHFLMLAVAVGSAAIGAWGEGAALLFLFSFSGALEHHAMGRTQREIRSLYHSSPKVATRVLDDGREVPTPVEQLQPGMRLLIRPGELFPVDGEVQSGRSSADESTLTGEAVPVDKSRGDSVLAGTLNLWGSVEMAVLRTAGESSLQKVIRLIQEAQHLKAPSQRFTDRFGTGYTYGILGLSAAMFLVWWLASGYPAFVSTPDTRSAFYRAMTLLVVASPCALVLSIPSAILAAIAWSARRGILFRGGAAVEKLAEVDVVALDKTGTLTTGELRVERVASDPPGSEPEVLRLACAIERLSSHPLARAVARHGRREGVPPATVEHFQSVTGQGVVARIEGREVRLGRREWVLDGRATAQDWTEGLGHSEVWLRSGDLLGCLVLRDDLRAEAPGLIHELRRLGLSPVVLTGDRPGAARALRDRIGVEDVRAGLKPEEKVAAIEALARQGRRMAMVGDGVNDAPSLAAAHVGVAMGARGADAALEQAEVVLMHDRLENFVTAFRQSQRARRIIRQNLVLSLGTVVLLVGLAMGSGLPLTLGVIGHEGSTVLVVLNSLRLLLRSEH